MFAEVRLVPRAGTQRKTSEDPRQAPGTQGLCLRWPRGLVGRPLAFLVSSYTGFKGLFPCLGIASLPDLSSPLSPPSRSPSVLAQPGPEQVTGWAPPSSTARGAAWHWCAGGGPWLKAGGPTWPEAEGGQAVWTWELACRAPSACLLCAVQGAFHPVMAQDTS